jgi:ribosome maturation factor RimP
MDSSNRISLRNQIRTVVEPTIVAAGFRLVAIELTGDQTGDIVRLYCDGAGFGVDDCARISRALSPVLDVEDPMESGYRLEVSSPGIDRPIQTSEDFVRFSGFRAKLRLVPGLDRRRYSGVLKGLEDGNIIIDVDGEAHLVPLNQLDWGQLVLNLDEFSRIQAANEADIKTEGAQS